MFLLTLYSRSKPYTTRAEAEKAAAAWIKRHLVAEYLMADSEDRAEYEKFNQAFRQERYGECVRVWNSFSKKHFLGDPTRLAQIQLIEVDQPF